MNVSSILNKLKDNPLRTIWRGVEWRLAALRQDAPALQEKYYDALLRCMGATDTHWTRVVMDRETESFMHSLPFEQMHAVEISGTKWQNFGFASYRSAPYPEFDICEGPLAREAFDVVIAEQVWEHLLWPYRATRHVYEMLRPGGWFINTTPFLYKVHGHPVDASRWTELGMSHLLAEGGFDPHQIRTNSWGNRACIRANLRFSPNYVPWKHSLKNEPDFPVVVWAFARK